MLHIAISTAGKLGRPYWRDACAEYVKRLKPFCKLEFIKTHDTDQPRWVDNHYAIAVTPKGKRMSSEVFAKALTGEVPRICFYIGGSDGLSAEFVKRCNTTLSLSDMTFTHSLARVLLLEQLYRGFQILNNTAYHK
ncbi:ribosomal RNA large subunit methyltransferase H [Clostridia bacterium]|nr:ribosomal RNA large subunit methyltransferase H [Clostridia bacterium]